MHRSTPSHLRRGRLAECRSSASTNGCCPSSARAGILHELRWPVAAALIAVLVLVTMPPAKGGAASASSNAPRARLRVRGEMPPALVHLRAGAPVSPSDPVTVTMTLNRSDQRGFDAYLARVGNPASSGYKHYLSQAQITARFGPSLSAYDRVLQWLESDGFTVVQGSADRLTITVRGTSARADAAFQVAIRRYRMGNRTVYANSAAPTLPRSVARDVAGISGLSNVATPQPVVVHSAHPASTVTAQLEGAIAQAYGPHHLAKLIRLFRVSESRSPRLAHMSEIVFDQLRSPQIAQPGALTRLQHSRAWRLVATTVQNLARMAPPASDPEVGSMQPVGFTASGSSVGASGAKNVFPEGAFCIHIGSCFQWKGNSDCLKGITQYLSGLITQLTKGVFAATAIAVLLVLFALMVSIYLGLLFPVVAGIVSTIGIAWAAFACLDFRVSWNPSPDPSPGGKGKSRRQTATRRGDLLPVKIGLLEFDSFDESDVKNWASLLDLRTSDLSHQISVTSLDGGVARPGAGESEVLLDIDTALSIDPWGAIAVYEAPSSASFEQLFNTMIEDHDTVISNSWAECEDQTSPTEAKAIDSVLAQAEASGISVFNGTGDDGGTCLDGSAKTVAVPADSPHAMAVGGSTPLFAHGLTSAGDRWWGAVKSNPPDGAGGFGVSRYFSRPAFQASFTRATGRSVPDLVADADPTAGIEICQQDAGGCPDGLLSGGTSMAAPEMAALTARLEQSVGRNLGLTPAVLYHLAQSTSGTFETAGAMRSDFAHVGLGLPDLNQWKAAVTKTKIGAVSATDSSAVGSVVNAGQVGLVTVSLRSVNGFPVGGKAVTITPSSTAQVKVVSGGATNITDGSASFEVTDPVPATVSFTVRDATDHITLKSRPSVVFLPPPATAGGISATLATVPADGTSSSTITVTLTSTGGKPAIDKAVSISEGSGHAIITGVGSTPGVTDANGQASYTVVDYTAETVSFTAVDVTDGDLPVPGSASVDFTNSGGGSNQCPSPSVVVTKGYALSTFASGFFDGHLNNGFVGCGGLGGMAWDSSGNAYVVDYTTGDIFKFGAGGGSPNNNAKITKTSLGPYLTGPVFGKNGDMYVDQWYTPAGSPASCGCIYQVNPSTGAIKRVVAENVPSTSLSIDPRSGDIFTSSSFDGGQDYSANILRIHDPGPGKPPANCATPGPGTGCTIFAALSGPTSGVAFDPNGTLYVGGAWSTASDLWSISGTNSKKPGVVTLLDSSLSGNATPVVLDPATKGKLPVLAVGGANGSLGQLDLNHHPYTVAPLIDKGVGAMGLGPDGCLYVGDSNTVSKLTTAKSTCPCPPPRAQLGAGIGLSQSTASGRTGSSVTLTAHLSGVANPARYPVRFAILGANSQSALVSVKASGVATFTFAGVHPGLDMLTAAARVGTKTLTSDTLFIRWKAGEHVTDTSLGLSPTSGHAGARLRFTASLTDATASPARPVGGQTMVLSAGGSRCTAATSERGLASCTLTLPNEVGTVTVHARYAGSRKEGYLPSSDTLLCLVAGTAARLKVNPILLSFGTVLVGKGPVRRFSVANSGGQSFRITTSSPPTTGGFRATTRLKAGTTLKPGQSLSESVRFAPRTIGPATATWVIGAGGASFTVKLTGTGELALDSAWSVLGSGGSPKDGAVQLTPATQYRAGSARAPFEVPTNGLVAAYTARQSGGTGGDGTTLTLARPSNTTFLGDKGGGLGFAGIDGVAVCLDTHQNGGEPGSNFVGIADGSSGGRPRYIATTTSVPALRPDPVHVLVTIVRKKITVSIDGTVVLNKSVPDLSAKARVLFTASTGNKDDAHTVSAVKIT